MSLKVVRSTAKSVASVAALTVAARGALYMSASSPKAPPTPYECTWAVPWRHG